MIQKLQPLDAIVHQARFRSRDVATILKQNDFQLRNSFELNSAIKFLLLGIILNKTYVRIQLCRLWEEQIHGRVGSGRREPICSLSRYQLSWA
jgi:hypothetical protein